MKPVVLVLLDGLGDRASDAHGGLTANEAAPTPVLDALCARGSNGMLWPLGPGRAPSSERAHWAMLGYRPQEFPGRAVLEARGWGLELRDDLAYAYAALRPAEQRDEALWVTGRAGPDDEDDARELVAAVAERHSWGFDFGLAYLHKGEAILGVSGGADPGVTDTDPFFKERDPVLDPHALGPDAARTAAALRAWTREVAAELGRHRVNTRRTKARLPALNVITTKWWGSPTRSPSFADRTGLTGVVLAASRFHAGLAATLELDFGEHPETADPAADLSARLATAAARLAAGATFVLVHHKATDEAGHTKDPAEKARVIAAIDDAHALLAEAPFANAIVCVTGDHATPTSPEVIHSGDPVPLVVVGPGVRADRVERFGELHQATGTLGHLRGEDVMPVLLNAADRPLFAGSRPVADPWALGHPLRPRALEVS